MSHPYQNLPPEAFWRSGVAEDAAPGALYRPQVRLGRSTAVATAGSCFAQHIGRALRGAGVRLLDAEPLPFPLPEAEARTWGFGLYSGRYGNIYTARQLVQLLQEVRSGEPATEAWARAGRFHDALRPRIEPEGLDSPEEVLLLRRAHLRALAAMLRETEVFIFTLGLTEAWTDRETGRVYPVAPGVVAGTFDPERHVLQDFTLPEVLADLSAALDLLRGFRRRMRMIVTVSPVALVATAGPAHVLTATVGAKAKLRAAAGAFVAAHRGTDYFPAYEIVTNPAARGAFLAPGAREVTEAGVARVMAHFLAAQDLAPLPAALALPAAAAEPDPEEGADALVCEELLLEAFAR